MTHTHSVHVVILDGCVCYLQDANDNKIKQYPADGATSPNSDDGIFEGQLQLSDQPVQGTWKIHVDAQVRPAAAATVTFAGIFTVLPHAYRFLSYALYLRFAIAPLLIKCLIQFVFWTKK